MMDKYQFRMYLRNIDGLKDNSVKMVNVFELVKIYFDDMTVTDCIESIKADIDRESNSSKGCPRCYDCCSCCKCICHY